MAQQSVHLANDVSEKLKMLSDEELGRIIDYIPQGAEYWNYARYCRDLRTHTENQPVNHLSYPFRYAQWCKVTKTWNDSVYTTPEGCADLTKLSEIRAELERRGLARQIVTGCKVVYAQDMDIYIVDHLLESETGTKAFLSSTHRNHQIEVDLQYIRRATPEEVTADHRLDLPTYDELLAQIKDKDVEIARLNAFIKEKLPSPVLELIDGEFKHSQIHGMLEIDGQWVYVTSHAGLSYEKSIGRHAARTIRRIVF